MPLLFRRGRARLLRLPHLRVDAPLVLVLLVLVLVVLLLLLVVVHGAACRRQQSPRRRVERLLPRLVLAGWRVLLRPRIVPQQREHLG